METVYQSKYLTIIIDNNNQLIRVVWSADTENMTDEEFRSELMKYVEISRERQLQKALIDTRNFLMTIVPETQQWVNTNVHQRADPNRKYKVAYLISKDFFSQVSIEQTMEEGNAEEIYETRYFENENDALKWLGV